MRKNFCFIGCVLFFLTLTTSNCNQEIYDDELSCSSRLRRIESLSEKYPIINEYTETFGEIIRYIQTVNSNKDIEELKKIIKLYQSIKSSNEATLIKSFKQHFFSLYTQDEINMIAKLKSRLDILGNELKNDTKIQSFTEYEQTLFTEKLALEFQDIKINFTELNNKENILMTRSENTSSECGKKCEDAYYWDLMAIAAGSICTIGGTIVTACASLGSLTLPALLALIVEIGGTSIAVDVATAEYRMCLNACND